MPTKGTVWLVSQYEPAPGDIWRPMRNEYLARCLLERGYSVLQWSATFQHQAKKQCAEPWEERTLGAEWKVRFVPNSSYSKNIGRDRLASEKTFAKNFLERAKQVEPPACLVMREPPCVLGEASVQLGQAGGFPVISDVIDLWPEFFYRVLPAPLRPMGRLIFSPLSRRRYNVWAKVNGLCAVSEAYVDHAKRVCPPLAKRPSACVYSSIEVDFVRSRLNNSSEIVASALGQKDSDEIWIGYAGSLGHGYQVPTMLAAAEILRVKAPNIRFVIAGVGPYVGDIKAAAAQPNSNITFVGHLKPDDLYPMLGRCDIGLLSYAADTTVAIPDKFYDYAAAGLPIANSLQGEVRQIIECHNIGRTFTPDSAESMADCIQFLASSSTIRSEMSERAVGAARTWDAPVHFQKFVDLIEETMKHFTVSVRL